MLVVHARAAAVQKVLCVHAYLTPCGWGGGGVLVEILDKWIFRKVFVFESVNFGDKIKFFSLQLLTFMKQFIFILADHAEPCSATVPSQH